MESYTESQRLRLSELGVSTEALSSQFVTAHEANREFQKYEQMALKLNRSHIRSIIEDVHETSRDSLQWTLAHVLRENGFTQLSTPTIISEKFLSRMGIDAGHPLRDQVFWIGDRLCLRPMLACGLYDISQKLLRFCSDPLRVFEMGSCYRRESKGNKHLAEFTMINIVEWNTPEHEREQRLKEITRLVLDTACVKHYTFVLEESAVYGKGFDVVDECGMELASSSMGPHLLDSNWGIDTSWVGIGFGIERLLYSLYGKGSIQAYGKSTNYLDGMNLNIN